MPNKNVKEEIIWVRLAPQDKTAIKARAQNQRETLSTYVKNLILAHLAQNPTVGTYVVNPTYTTQATPPSQQ